MGKKKKDTMELRFYEVPQGEYVLALLGDNWIRDYGHDESNLHFHNLMEIGYCKNGTGELILNEETKRYEPAMVSIIPQNYPHVTISDIAEGPSYWEYLFFDPMVMIQELYPDNAVIRYHLPVQPVQETFDPGFVLYQNWFSLHIPDNCFCHRIGYDRFRCSRYKVKGNRIWIFP